MPSNKATSAAIAPSSPVRAVLDELDEPARVVWTALRT
jgi:hypothetical protein